MNPTRWKSAEAKRYRVRWLQSEKGQAYLERDRKLSATRSRARRERIKRARSNSKTTTTTR